MKFLARVHLQKGIAKAIDDLESYIEKCGKLTESGSLGNEAKAYFASQILEAREAIVELKNTEESSQ